ncbi:RMD1 family protein [Trichlorobacter lovleyi]|uniref:RMD1 family protein n=1 Tax=Trichlorobacter lovleyi TaxID=313985 RepID=UPI0022401ECD|nr:RMD1 family protein [Trichlorobacter lovleyi]QOX77824.1 RMD1 family protein [Trichlorobacter lovleyi]
MTEPLTSLYSFTAFAIGGDLDLNRLAVRLGIDRKYRWEEPMRLNPVTFTPSAASDAVWVYLFYFGGIVFLNCGDDIIARCIEGLKQHLEQLKEQPQLRFREDYRLEITPDGEPSITNDCAVMPVFKQELLEIICFVIAKSVALERIEEHVDAVFDEVGVMINRLGQGVLELPDKRLAKLASVVLGFKYTSIAHIMVLDKPESTWDNDEADRFYLTISNLFELRPRYQEIKHKAETLLDVTDVFSSLSHARRSARLEWIIIILIAFEIIMALWQKFWGG